MMNFSIDDLRQWQTALDMFGKQRISRLARKTWDKAIQGEPVRLLGQAPNVLQKKITTYRQKPPLTRWFLARLTSIQQEEKILQYYLNRQLFNNQVSLLSDEERERLAAKKPKSRQNFQATSPSSSFSEISTNPSLSRAWGQYTREANKIYKKQGEYLRKIYTHPQASFEVCVTEEAQLAKKRKEGLDNLQNKTIKNLKCTKTDKETLIKEIKKFVETAEKALDKKISALTFNPVTPHAARLRNRYLEPYALVKTGTFSFNQVSTITELFNEPQPKRLEELRQTFKSNLPSSIEGQTQLIKEYCEIAEAYLKQLRTTGQQAIIKAKTEFRAKDTTRQLSAVQPAVKEIYEKSVNQINLFVRHTLAFIHPNQKNQYSGPIKAAMEEGSKQFTSAKDKQLNILSQTLEARDLFEIRIELAEERRKKNEDMEQKLAENRVSGEEQQRELDLLKQQIAADKKATAEYKKQTEETERIIKEANEKTKATDLRTEKLQEKVEALEKIQKENEIKIKKLMESMGVSEEQLADSSQTGVNDNARNTVKFF